MVANASGRAESFTPGLWQRPKESFSENDETWYCNIPVGEKKLKTFLPELSAICNLSQRYTNHSIRATCATILSRGKYNYAQIKSVTGHKSVQSLAIYQKVNEKEKLHMGRAISESLTHQPCLPPPAKRLALEYGCASLSLDIVKRPTSSTASLSELEGVEMEKLLCDFDSCGGKSTTLTCTSSTSALKSSSNPFVFNNCSVQIIQNLNVSK